MKIKDRVFWVLTIRKKEEFFRKIFESKRRHYLFVTTGGNNLHYGNEAPLCFAV